MTAKEALIQSIYKYSWFAIKPCIPITPKRFENCALCLHSYEVDKVLNIENNDCSTCVMFNLWPALNKIESEKCSNGAWDYWEDLSAEREQGDYRNSYDFVFFSLLLVEAFHSRLQELYKNDKDKT